MLFRMNLKLLVLVGRKFQKITLYIRADFQSVVGTLESLLAFVLFCVRLHKT